MIKSSHIEALLQKPLTQCDPMALKDALLMAYEYICIAERHGCTSFNDFSMMKAGFFPLEELRKNEGELETVGAPISS